MVAQQVYLKQYLIIFPYLLLKKGWQATSQVILKHSFLACLIKLISLAKDT